MKEKLLVALATKERLELEQTAAIGDGANDRWMLQKAGFGVAYHGKDILKQATKHHLNAGNLRTFGYFLGKFSPARASNSLRTGRVAFDRLQRRTNSFRKILLGGRQTQKLCFTRSPNKRLRQLNCNGNRRGNVYCVGGKFQILVYFIIVFFK